MEVLQMGKDNQPEYQLGPNIHWYPGHMTRARRKMEEDLRLVDLLAEVVDARIPRSSRNPDIDVMAGDRPRLIILNRVDQADPAMTAQWLVWFKKQGWGVLETDAKQGKGVSQFPAAARAALKDKLQSWRAKGQVGRPIRVMVAGIPNVGKSTFINKLAGRKSAKVGDRPGVTRGKQWVTIDRGLELLDTPGILWPKFEDHITGLHLAFTGAVRDEVIETEELACALLELLQSRYPRALEERYKLAQVSGQSPWELLEQCARKRGMLLSGGVLDTQRMSAVLLDELRGGKLGRLTFEVPDER